MIAYRVLLLTPENSPPMGIGSPPPRWRCGLWHWASRAMKPMGNHRCSGWNTQESRACLVTGCGSSSIFSPKLQDTGTSALGSEPVGTGPPTTRIPGLELFGIHLDFNDLSQSYPFVPLTPNLTAITSQRAFINSFQSVRLLFRRHNILPSSHTKISPVYITFNETRQLQGQM